MDNATQILPILTTQQQHDIDETVKKERNRLFNFIRKRVSDEEDAEDILQDVFFQLVESYRLMKPIEQVTSWLFTVARNKITDRYRKKKPVPVSHQLLASYGDGEEGVPALADILPDFSSIPDEMYARSLVWEVLEEALDQLPEEQREVFVLHEFENKSFKEISEITGKQVNTLISRKRYAVVFLREQLRELYNEL
jgi:RNA polymerase sigma factor (sigma-70 family)